ncbi:MAG: cation:proton antiporter [Haloarculaceae archaeon]
MAAGSTLLLELGAVFAAVAVAGGIARLVDQSVIPFYVLAGMVTGPFVLGRLGVPAIPDGEVLTLLAELGIVLLLFFLGLEFSLDRLLERRGPITRAGLIDLLVNFPVGVAIGLVLGWTPVEALVLGGIVYISSSAIITKSLIDLGWIANAESEPILGTLVFEDLFIAVYLAVLSALLLGGGGGLEGALVDVGVAVGFLSALVVVVWFGTAAFERLLAVDSQEMTVVRTLAVTVTVAGAALALGISEAVAAFFVGMGFSPTDHVHDLEQLLSPLRDAFAAVFFFWIGIGTDPRLILGTVGLLAVTVVATTPPKLLSGYYGAMAFDLDRRRAVRTGAAMVTRGEFSLIIAALAAGGSGVVLTETIPALAVGYVLVMSVLGSVLMDQSTLLERLLPGGEPTGGA